MSTKKEDMTPEKASETYVAFEREIENLRKKIKSTPRRVTQDMYRRRIKSLREKQNMLYPIMVHTGYVEITQDILGLKPKKHSLYKRYARSKKNSNNKKS